MKLIEFIIASSLLTLLPGPDILFVLTQSMIHGRKAGISVALGLCSGLFVHTATAALGLSLIISSSPTLFAIIKYAGILYLLWMGYTSLRSYYKQRNKTTDAPSINHQEGITSPCKSEGSSNGSSTLDPTDQPTTKSQAAAQESDHIASSQAANDLSTSGIVTDKVNSADSSPAAACSAHSGMAVAPSIEASTAATASTANKTSIDESSPSRLYRIGVTMNLLNPKVILFFLAFFPQFASKGATGWQMASEMGLLGVVFTLCAFVVMAGCALFAGVLSDTIRSPRVQFVLNKASALIFLGLAVAAVVAQ